MTGTLAGEKWLSTKEARFIRATPRVLELYLYRRWNERDD